MKITVKLTQSELQDIIKAHFGLSIDVDVVITNEAKQNESSSEWIDVPFDWNKRQCPSNWPDNTTIEVLYADGMELITLCGHLYGCWNQRGTASEIVKYRKVN